MKKNSNIDNFIPEYDFQSNFMSIPTYHLNISFLKYILGDNILK